MFEVLTDNSSSSLLQYLDLTVNELSKNYHDAILQRIVVWYKHYTMVFPIRAFIYF